MTICPHPDDPVPTFNCVLKTVENINTAKSLQKSRKQFASRWKRSPTRESWYLSGYTSNLFFVWVVYLNLKTAVLLGHPYLKNDGADLKLIVELENLFVKIIRTTNKNAGPRLFSIYKSCREGEHIGLLITGTQSFIDYYLAKKTLGTFDGLFPY